MVIYGVDGVAHSSVLLQAQGNVKGLYQVRRLRKLGASHNLKRCDKIAIHFFNIN